MNEPKLRFPEFTDDWKQYKLGDVCKTNGRIGFRGYTEKDIISKDAGGVLTFSPTNIVDNQLTIKVKNTYITREKYEESPEIMVKNGNILFVKTGSTLGKSALVSEVEEDCTVNPQMVVIKADVELQKILSVVLISASVQKQIAAIKIGGAVPTMTETELKNINLVLPQNDDERIKLGEYFSNLDSLIQSAEKELEGYRELKQGMLQKMFPKKGETVPEIRFPEFTGDWKSYKVSEVAEKTFGGGTPKTSNETFWEGDIPWIQSSDLVDGNLFDINPKKYISQEAINKSAAKLIPENSIAVVTRVGVGKLAFIPFSYATSQDFLSLSELKTEPQFTSYSLYKRLQQDLCKVQGTSIKGITKDELLIKEIMVPSYEEQKKIGSYFSNLDNLIAFQQKELDGYKELKKGLLQQMFC